MQFVTVATALFGAAAATTWHSSMSGNHSIDLNSTTELRNTTNLPGGHGNLTDIPYHWNETNRCVLQLTEHDLLSGWALGDDDGWPAWVNYHQVLVHDVTILEYQQKFLVETVIGNWTLGVVCSTHSMKCEMHSTDYAKVKTTTTVGNLDLWNTCNNATGNHTQGPIDFTYVAGGNWEAGYGRYNSTNTTSSTALPTATV